MRHWRGPWWTVEVRGWALNRPYAILCDPDEDGRRWLGLSYGNGNSDPVVLVDLHLTARLSRLAIRLFGERWKVGAS